MEGVDDTVRSLVLNGLRDVVKESAIVLEDDASRSLLRDTYRMTTDKDRRARFEWALREIVDATTPADDAWTAIQVVVDDVVNELYRADIKITTTHRTGIRIDDREATVFTFVQTRAVSAFDGIANSSAVANPIRRGGALVESAEFDAAIDEFEKAADVAVDTDDAVLARVLAAWSSHWAGADMAACDLAEEAVQLDEGAWTGHLARAIAGYDAPERFRNGPLGTPAYLRIRADVPDGTTVSAATTFDDENNADWHVLDGDIGFLPLPRLAPKTGIKIRLTGTVDSFPSLFAYYLAVGVADLENRVPRSVERKLLDGPTTAEPTETVRLRQFD